jgi:hypothetical protein
MSNPRPLSETDTPPIRASHSRLQSDDLDHVDNALVALQVKDAATMLSPTHGARSNSFGAGGRL